MTAGAFPADSTLAQWANEPLIHLTTIGRQTGRPHRIEIWFAPEGDSIYLLSGGRDRSDWVRNIQANPHVTVDLGPETRTGTARVLEPDTIADRRARELLVTKYQHGNNLDDWGRTSLAVIIDLAAPEGDTYR